AVSVTSVVEDATDAVYARVSGVNAGVNVAPANPRIDRLGTCVASSPPPLLLQAARNNENMSSSCFVCARNDVIGRGLVWRNGSGDATTGGGYHQSVVHASARHGF
ncbi:MAG: hypothetical protein ACJAUC_003437, partial [Planctomycetota bacterium]